MDTHNTPQHILYEDIVVCALPVTFNHQRPVGEL